MWIYSQRFGTLYRQGSASDSPVAVATGGYAGTLSGRNDPTAQCLQDFGPLPRGKYVISAVQDAPTRFSLVLTPDPTNDMCSPVRRNFLIHGDRAAEPPFN
jgi:hypothetical protein